MEPDKEYGKIFLLSDNQSKDVVQSLIKNKNTIVDCCNVSKTISDIDNVIITNNNYRQ